MRFVVPGVALALCAVGCSDDSTGSEHVGFDASQRDDGGRSDGGPLDAQVQIDATVIADGALADHSMIDPACIGRDQFEPDNAADAGAALPLGLGGSANFRAGVAAGDPDWFTFVAPKSDPVSVRATYAVEPGSVATLSLFVDDALGSEVANDTRARDGLSQTLSVLFEAVANGSYFIDIENSVQVCTAYDATVDVSACSDSFEDNDTSATAVALPSGTLTASANALEKDFYLSFGSAGTCTLQYTVPAASTQQLSLALLDAADAPLTKDDRMRTSTSQTLTVTWADGDHPAYLVVAASDPECTDYTLSCP